MTADSVFYTANNEIMFKFFNIITCYIIPINVYVSVLKMSLKICMHVIYSE